MDEYDEIAMNMPRPEKPLTFELARAIVMRDPIMCQESQQFIDNMAEALARRSWERR